MLIKYFAGAVAVILLVAYLLPVVLKLKDLALGAVIAIGITMMLVDVVQSLKSKDD
jgi:hypothetical protein